MDSGRRPEHLWVLAAVVGLHLLAGRWLVSWAPPGPTRMASRDDALLVEFIEAPAPRSKPVLLPGSRTAPLSARHAPGAGRPVSDARTPVSTPSTVASADTRAPAASGPLDLGIPPPVEPVDTIRRSAFDRPPPALPGRATQFERAWVPSGDALEVASWRSPVVRGVLGLFGGPPKRCSEVERRLRGLNCLTDEDDFGP